MPLDDDRRTRPGAEIPKHGQQRLPTPFLVDVIADLTGLEVTNDDLVWITRPRKTLIERRNRQQLLIFQRPNRAGVQPVAPFRVHRRLLMHRQPLGKPPRHPMLGRR